MSCGTAHAWRRCRWRVCKVRGMQQPWGRGGGGRQEMQRWQAARSVHVCCPWLAVCLQLHGITCTRDLSLHM